MTWPTVFMNFGSRGVLLVPFLVLLSVIVVLNVCALCVGAVGLSLQRE